MGKIDGEWNMRDYKNLTVWKESMELARAVYRLCRMFPPEERYALADQMRRAAVSIPSNIAEGHDRHSDKEFRRFLLIAKGSAAELDTQLILCRDFGYIQQEEAESLLSQCAKIRAKLYNFINKLSD